jgi:hypothetical protein
MDENPRLCTDCIPQISRQPIGQLLLTPSDCACFLGKQTQIRLALRVVGLGPRGQGLTEAFSNYTTTGLDGAVGTLKAFHFHRRRTDCWAPVEGMLQVALMGLRKRQVTSTSLQIRCPGYFVPSRSIRNKLDSGSLAGRSCQRAGALQVRPECDGLSADQVVDDDDPHMLPGQSARGGANGGIADRRGRDRLVEVPRGDFQRDGGGISHGFHRRDETAGDYVPIVIAVVGYTASTPAAHQAEYGPIVEDPLRLAGNQNSSWIGSSVALLNVLQTDVVDVERTRCGARGIRYQNECQACLVGGQSFVRHVACV